MCGMLSPGLRDKSKQNRARPVLGCRLLAAALAAQPLRETHFMPTPGDETGLRRLGVNLTSEPRFATKDLFAG